MLRVIKLAHRWQELNRLLTTLGRSVAAVCNLSLILLLFIFVFALLGLQLFGYRMLECDASTPGALPLCPPGLDPVRDCPPHRDCYVA